MGMQRVSFAEIVERVVERDPRYQREAYSFLREALDFTQKKYASEKPAETPGREEAAPMEMPGQEPERHVTGQQLVQGIREYALAEFGPMTKLVLNEWGLHECRDFGEIVFNLIEAQVLRKTDSDTREDFHAGYTFEEAFVHPFLPASALKRLTQEARAGTDSAG